MIQADQREVACLAANDSPAAPFAAQLSISAVDAALVGLFSEGGVRKLEAVGY
jgi:hypothetical protein